MTPGRPFFLRYAALAFLLSFGHAALSATLETLVLPLVPRGAVWRYLDNGSNQGTSWIGPDFNDNAWASGPARLGYGGDSEVTTVSYGPNSGAKYITTYFRRLFEISDTNIFQSLKLRLVRDDGAVVYLNGAEVFRSNMPAIAINYLTPATAVVSGGDEFIAQETNLPPALLRSGTNVLAVEVHQSGGGSSDVGFDLALDAEYATLPQPLALVTTHVTNQAAVSWPQLSVGHVLQMAAGFAQ